MQVTVNEHEDYHAPNKRGNRQWDVCESIRLESYIFSGRDRTQYDQASLQKLKDIFVYWNDTELFSPYGIYMYILLLMSRLVTQRLRFSSSSSLIVSRIRLSTVGDRAFPVSDARIWNSLPDLVTSAPSVAVFRSRLKTHLFNISYIPFPLVTVQCLHSDA